MEQFDTKYFSGQGPVFLGGRDASGNPAGLIFIGDVSEATLTPQVDNVEVIESVSGTGAVGASWTKSVGYDLSMTLKSAKPEHLAQSLQGTMTVKATGSVTGEAVTGYLDKMTPLQYPKVNTVVVKNSAGTVTYAAGTDYVLHADIGMIEPLSTGTITDGQALQVDYAYAAQRHVTANPQNVESYLVFSGLNRADNSKQVRCEIYKLKLDPGVLGLIQSEEASIPVTGKILLDTLRAAGDQLYSWKIED